LTDYYHAILNRLRGETDDLRGVANSRLDWYGLDAVLDLYHRTAGEDREAFVQAAGQILAEGEQPVEVIAQLLYLVTSLDLTQVEPSIKRLRQKAIANQEPLRGVIANYFAFRELRQHHAPAP